MRRSIFIGAAAVLAILSGVFPSARALGAESLTADLSGTGTFAVWLSGLEFRARIAGELQLAGEVLLGDEAVPFAAEGTLRGLAVYGIVTSIGEGWVGYTATGSTSDGEAIEIRGLLHAMRKSLIPLQAGDVFVGTQFAVIDLRGEVRSFSGEFSGAVEGGLEPSETPGTIQLSGVGVFHLTGEIGGFSPSIRLDHPALTPEFLHYLAELDLGI
jgi:hypothetical protein